MPRISISLPNELVVRLEPVKDKINVSQVCREALDRRIAMIAGASEQDGLDGLDLESLVSRFREERRLVEGQWEELGRKNGGAWLSGASYLELKNVIERPPSSNMEEYKLPTAAFRIMKRDMEQANGVWKGGMAVTYKTAWLDYVKSIWARIESEVEASASVPQAQSEE